MTRITQRDLQNAFPGSKAADKLGKKIDDLGSGATRNDGELEPEEIEAALQQASRPLGGRDLRSDMKEVFGSDFRSAIPDAKTFGQRVETELKVQEITQQDLYADLLPLCKDPVLSVRDAMSSEYLKSAEFVAQKLKEAGGEPAGDIVDGQRTMLQYFRWENRFAPGTISCSANVIAKFPGKGKPPRKAIFLTGHLDNLSQAEKADYKRRDGRDLSHYEGANDNATAVVSVLEVVRSLGEVDADVYAIIPSAEEDGCMGTKALMMAPPCPKEDILALFNAEMLGHNDIGNLLVYGGLDAHEAQINPLYHRMMKVAEQAGIHVKPGHQNDDNEGWGYRSEQIRVRPFGIPWIMLQGRTTTEYHTENDTLESLNMPKVELAARLMLRAVRDLANDPNPDEAKGMRKDSWDPFPGRVWVGEGGPMPTPPRR